MTNKHIFLTLCISYKTGNKLSAGIFTDVNWCVEEMVLYRQKFYFSQRLLGR